MVMFELLNCDLCCFISKTTMSPLHCIKYKKLPIYITVKATKSHIQNSKNHFNKTQSDRTTNWRSYKPCDVIPFNVFHPALSRKPIGESCLNWNSSLTETLYFARNL